MCLLEGKKRQEMVNELKMKFWPTYKVGCTAKIVLWSTAAGNSIAIAVLRYTGCTYNSFSITHPADGLESVASCTGKTGYENKTVLFLMCC